jgi:hypothetical protein
MQPPREQDSVGRRPWLKVVRSEPRQSDLGREHERRLPAHLLEFDQRGRQIA